MKLYTDRGGLAPSPRRVRIFCAEKNLAIPVEELDLHVENRTDAFRAKNRTRTLPVLELDDGSCIAESLAICRYLEELQPEPRLFGETPLERARVEMWTRRAELFLYLPIDFSSPGALPDGAGAAFREGLPRTFRFFDRVLGERRFLVGERYGIADLVAQVALDFGARHVGVSAPPACEHLARWYAEVSARPSARA